MNLKINKIRLPELIGKGYKDFWNFKGRYRVCKGSRASKKSKTAALFFIYSIMKYPGANLLVVRKVFRTLKDSCFTDLKWAINRLQVQEYWDIKESPLEMIYKPTGQKILFRGLDDPMKITSITVEVGSLCWAWINKFGSRRQKINHFNCWKTQTGDAVGNQQRSYLTL
jgi:phage terminase large subunit